MPEGSHLGLGELPSIATGGLFSAGFITLIALLIRQILPWRKQNIDSQQSVIDTLKEMIKDQTARIDKVEMQLASERRMHFIEIRRVEARHSAQRSLDRHKLNNAEACIDALLSVLELSPEKASEAAKLAKQRRADDKRNEQTEAAQIHAAEITAVAAATAEFTEMEKNNGTEYP